MTPLEQMPQRPPQAMPRSRGGFPARPVVRIPFTTEDFRRELARARRNHALLVALVTILMVAAIILLTVYVCVAVIG